jgi:tRNA-dihydrouridine synthase
MLTLYGARQGIRHARKHLGWYLGRHAPQAPAALRALLLTSDDIPVVQHAIAEAFGAGAAAERLAA